MSNMNTHFPEVLAPAGSWDALVAAINAGANAVYLGGSRFGARAYANNFQEEELLKAIDLCQIHNKKIYLTVNTLFKNDEIDKLYEYLYKPYCEGLDAVIVQDLGAVRLISDSFPRLNIHGSTQMTISNVQGASLIKRLGLTRVVPSRELSLAEIKNIKDITKLEMEVFVQGALCYCYSGQCLMSSIIGGRSGNRGRCAQPCRLPYDVYKNNIKISDMSSMYPLSPKDMCCLEHIPELIAAGVDSFKIEGRMKSKEYVEACVSSYRKAVDAYYSKSNLSIDDEKDKLKEIYNRGGFNNSYLKEYNGKDMMSLGRPNHQGILVGTISSLDANIITIDCNRNIYIGDVLELRTKGNINIELTSNALASANSKLKLKGKNIKQIHKGDKVYRTRCNHLMDELNDKYFNSLLKEKVQILLMLRKDKNVSITMDLGEMSINVQGDIVQKALTKPMDKNNIKEKLSKLGNTPFEANSIDIDMDDDAFIPISSINELRRKTVEELQNKIVTCYYRNDSKPYICNSSEISNKTYTQSIAYTVLLVSLDQLYAVFPYNPARIYIEEAYVDDSTIYEMIDICRSNSIEVFLALPSVYRGKNLDIDKFLNRVDGLLIRNIDELGYITNSHMNDIKICFDYSLYAYNNVAISTLDSLYKDAIYTYPLELNKEEISKLANYNREIIGYGYTRVMTSVQCINKNYSICDSKSDVLKINDQKNNVFYSKCVCKHCYNEIFNGKPLMLLDKDFTCGDINVLSMRLEFRLEDTKTVQEIMKLAHSKALNILSKDYTRGHYNRGIE